MIRTTEDHVHVLYAFDALIMDAFSVIMLARELRDTYDGNVCDEKLELSFRDYVLETEKMQDEYEADKKFWMEKVDDFPSAPAFQFKTLPENIKSLQNSRKHLPRNRLPKTSRKPYSRQLLLCSRKSQQKNQSQKRQQLWNRKQMQKSSRPLRKCWKIPA